MTAIEWKKWLSKRDNPLPETDIIVRKKNGDVVFAYYAEMSCYLFLTYKVDGDMIQTYVIRDFFDEGDEWTYVDSLKRQQDKSLKQEARNSIIDEIEEALLSEVLPCFMHGGEADEVVAKLDEVLSKKSKEG